jgi:hypothetical protein
MEKKSKNTATEQEQGIEQISTEDLLNILDDNLDTSTGVADLGKKKDSVKTDSSIKEIEDMDIEDVLKELQESKASDNKVDDKSKEDDRIIVNGQPEIVETDEETTTTTSTELGEYEEDITSFFTDEFSKELGWEFTDEEKPKTVKEVVDMMRSLIEENSKPEYGDERVAKLDEYVKNGGKFEDFYTTAYSNKLALDEIDIENEAHQKQILKEHLINTGMKDSQIDKKIRRWEDAGVLSDEAEEALEAVKEFRAETEKRLLSEQKKAAAEAKASQQKFINDVDETIKNMKDVFGVPLTDKQKKDTLEYIFKPIANGASQYQIDFSKDPKHLVLSAYLQKFGSNMVKSIEKGAETKAAKTLREKLASSKGKRGITQAVENTDRHDIFSTWSSQFLPK